MPVQRSDPPSTHLPAPSSLERDLDRALRAALRRREPVPRAAQVWDQAVSELCLRPSKRIRPRLCALAYQGVCGEAPPPGVLDFAVGLELLHAFMLVHDDLIDRARLRRGGPTLHRALAVGLARSRPGRAEDLAMLGGDSLFAAAVEAMLEAEVPEGRGRAALLSVMAGARQAALGETLDVLYEAVPLCELSAGSLAQVLRLKTASYSFVAPLVSGAILGGADSECQRVLGSFGERVGIAFQLADDLLDLLGKRGRLGKPIGGDLREGKRTVLMRLLVERVTGPDRKRLLSILDRASRAQATQSSAGAAKVRLELRFVAGLLTRSGVAAEMVTRVRNLVRAASRELSRVPLEPMAEKALRGLSSAVVTSLGGLA